MRFWDSSAVVPLLVAQPQTRILQGLVRSDSAMLVWWSTVVECASALERLRRMGQLSDTHRQAGMARLRLLSETWQEIQPNIQIQTESHRLLQRHPLTAADALQLAAARVVVSGRTPSLPFVCLDERLRLAAGGEGFALLP